jgi:ABC-type dipeptide/oligopeptide/nickel transport system permease component
MTGYLVRRFFQMIIVVLLSTVAIYLLLNLAPGGPLSGLNLGADRKSRFSEADKARIESYLGLDKPLALRYLAWLIGEDWLGADWLYLGLSPYTAPKLDAEGNQIVNDEGFRPCVRDQFDEMQELQIAALLDAPVVEACTAQITADEDGVEDKTQYRSCLQKEFRAYKKVQDVPEGAVTECGGGSDARAACWEASLTEERLNKCDATREVVYMEPRRFWADPGPAYLNPGYEMWVWGEEREENVFHAERIAVRPEGERPDDVAAVGLMVSQEGGTIVLEPVGAARKYTVISDDDTEFIFPSEGEAQPRPEGGAWLNVGWLFGSNGLLSKYSGFHGDQRGVLRMDWGVSWKLAAGQPVSDLIRSRLGNTVLLMSTAAIISLLVAIPLGIYSAVHQYSKMDYVVTTFSFFGTAMPVFWFGLMMILLFSYLFKQWGEFAFSYLAAIVPVVTIVAYRVRRNVRGRVEGTEWRLWVWGTVIAMLVILVLGLGPKVNVPLYAMPAGGTQTLKTQAEPGTLLAAINATPNGIIDRLVHIVLPATVLSLLYMAGWSRFMRSSMLEVLRQDYVRTARAKGLHERAVIAKHALRNALIPIITIVVFQIPGIFGGAILTETIFSYPGIGRLYFTALGQNDWPIVMIFLFITAILVVVATLLGDILYTVVDPRIRFS